MSFEKFFIYIDQIYENIEFKEKMGRKKKISHLNKSNKITDSSYDASVNKTVNDFKKTMKKRNIRKVQKEIQMKNGDPSEPSYQFIKSLSQLILGCGSVFMLHQVKFLNFTQTTNQASVV